MLNRRSGSIMANERKRGSASLEENGRASTVAEEMVRVEKKAKVGAGSSKRKHKNWSPTAEQLVMLVKHFDAGLTKPGKEKVTELFHELKAFGDITEKNIRLWFMNRLRRFGKTSLHGGGDQKAGGSASPPPDVDVAVPLPRKKPKKKKKKKEDSPSRKNKEDGPKEPATRDTVEKGGDGSQVDVPSLNTEMDRSSDDKHAGGDTGASTSRSVLRVRLPHNLKQYLIAEYVMLKDKVAPRLEFPASPCIGEILDLWMEETASEIPKKTRLVIEGVEDAIAGLKSLVNMLADEDLLFYPGEKELYGDIRRAKPGAGGGGPGTEAKECIHPEAGELEGKYDLETASSTYGAEHLLRCIILLPKVLPQQKEKNLVQLQVRGCATTNASMLRPSACKF